MWCDVSCACGCGWVLCCVVLCCAVLCCAVLCCAVLCCVVLCCVVLGCVVLCALLHVVCEWATAGGEWRMRLGGARLGLAGSAPAMPRTSHNDPARDPLPISRILTTVAGRESTNFKQETQHNIRRQAADPNPADVLKGALFSHTQLQVSGLLSVFGLGT